MDYEKTEEELKAEEGLFACCGCLLMPIALICTIALETPSLIPVGLLGWVAIAALIIVPKRKRQNIQDRIRSYKSGRKGALKLSVATFLSDIYDDSAILISEDQESGSKNSITSIVDDQGDTMLSSYSQYRGIVLSHFLDDAPVHIMYPHDKIIACEIVEDGVRSGPLILDSGLSVSPCVY